MDIVISHKSALEYWRLHSRAKIDDTARLRRKNPPASLPGIADIRGRVPSKLSYPINLMVSSQNAKRKSALFQPRVYAGRLPDWCFISIGDGLAVSSPAFCFFQMASELPLVKLIELGLELCGTYSLSVKDEYVPGMDASDRNEYDHPQLASKKALENLTARMAGANGYKKACQALRYIAEGSASPMETILFMLLALPHKLGGYELPVPVMNRRIDNGQAARQRSGTAYHSCDLFWPEAGFAVEYDSDFYHTGANRIAKDAEKRNNLADLDITVITVTSRQVRIAAEFDGLARLIARKLHKRLRYENPRQFLDAKRELRRLLLR